VRGVEPFVYLQTHLEVHLREAGVALAADTSIEDPLDDEHSIGPAQFEPDADRLRKNETLERLEGHLIFHHHQLAAAR
jgi:hypothetical protein